MKHEKKNLGVRPQEVAHGPGRGHLHGSIEFANVIEAVEEGRQAAVAAEDLGV